MFPRALFSFFLSLGLACAAPTKLSEFEPDPLSQAGQDGSLMVELYSGAKNESDVHNERSALKAYQIARAVVDEGKASTQTDAELALYLHNYLIKNCKYANASGKDGFVSTLLLKKKGVCEHYARTYFTLCTMAGLKCKCVFGSANGQPHAWNMIELDGEWVHVDCTWDDPIRNKRELPWYVYFGVPDDAISTSHEWDSKKYPACSSRTHWHAWNHVSHYDTVEQFVSSAAEEAKSSGGKCEAYGYVKEIAKNPRRLKGLVKKVCKKQWAEKGGFRYEYFCYGSGALHAFLIFRVSFP